MDEQQGRLLLEIARKTIESHLFNRPYTPEYPESFSQSQGAFVTLTKNGSLRGCIGFPEPTYPLIEAVQKAAISAASEDPRFPPILPDEWKGIKIEVTVLTPPALLQVADPSEYPGEIEVGRDGLIVESGFSKGLLLPQVPVEWKWDEVDFLSQTCLKAGLPPDEWKQKSTKIYTFQGEIFSEKEEPTAS